MRAYKTKQGNWQLNYSDGGVQRTLYLGRRFTAASAERTAKIITELVEVRKRGESPAADLLRNVGTLPARIQSSLERLGLIRCCFGLSVGGLCEQFLLSKQHLKAGTIRTYRECRQYLIQHFGHERSIASVSESDAESFIGSLRQRLSDVTISSYLRRFQAFFRFAVKEGFLSRSPFDIKFPRVDYNAERMFYIDSRTIEKVLPFCRDDRERLALTLGRFGGLRVPSELLGMRLCDFSGDVVRIANDTKTGWREVPVFPAVRQIVERLSGSLLPGAFIFGGVDRLWARRIFLRALSAAGVVGGGRSGVGETVGEHAFFMHH